MACIHPGYGNNHYKNRFLESTLNIINHTTVQTPRISEKYQVESIAEFNEKLLLWAQQFDVAVWLDSNNYEQKYSNFDAVLAVGVASKIESKPQDAFNILNLRFKENTNVKCIQKGVSSSKRCGMMKLYFHNKVEADDEHSRIIYSQGCSTMSDKHNVNQSNYTLIELVDLAGVIRKINNKIKVLKVDIEGGEREVFSGRPDWISKVGALIIEIQEWLRPECEKSVRDSTSDFDVEWQQGENVYMIRNNACIVSKSVNG